MPSPTFQDPATAHRATTDPATTLRLFDSASAKVVPVEFRDPGSVSMYVCGPTVYDVPHLGHGRFSLVFDVLRRYLLFCGYQVRYVSNITDIDDKIIDRAARESRSEADVAAEYEAVWWQSMDGLGVLRPTVAPRATEYVADMVALIADLVERGKAYETSDGVYLASDEVEGYGLLALQPMDKLRSGARVEGHLEKHSPLDFALWKKAKPGEPTWPSPWGDGRPGWHTECVVMSLGLLGDGFDLHGGGQDLRFPHHENERAQAVALGRAFAHYWVHNGFVEVEGEKMSKSLGNFTSLSDLLERADPRAYRLLVLQAHYRSPIEVTPDTVAAAEESLSRLDTLARRFDLAPLDLGGPGASDVPPASGPGEPSGSSSEPTLGFVDLVEAGGGDDQARSVADRFRAALDDDLDTSAALAQIYELVRAAHTAADSGDVVDGRRLAAMVTVMAGALGVRVGDGGSEIDPESAALVAARDEARDDRDWAQADSLRDQLKDLGWVVEDSAAGTKLHRPAGGF